MAVREWTKLRNGEPVSIARAIAAFDLFIPESPVESLSDVRMGLEPINDTHKISGNEILIHFTGTPMPR